MWSDATVAAALGQPARAADDTVSYSQVSTDTRTLEPGALFIALRGETHDGHDFLAAAARAGALAAVVESVPPDAPSMRYYVVHDTLIALGRLARFHRRRLGVRVCAITGSNGKTTTKELIKAVLSTGYRVHATAGNLNNRVGLPLTLLLCPRDAQIVVAELGTNEPGEVAILAAIAEPEVAVVTNISAEHLEGLGDLEGVLREETAVLTWLPADGTAIVPDEPATLAERARRFAARVRVAGFSSRADVGFRGSDLHVDEVGRARFRWANQAVALQLRGRHNARNALLALTAGRTWGIDDRAAARAIATQTASSMRAELKRAGDLTLVVDCYNANPASVLAAIDLLSDLPRGGGRVAVLGTMLEMGAASAAVHSDVARNVVERDLDLIVGTGAFSEALAPFQEQLGERLIRVEDPIAAWELAEVRIPADAVVLLKASRGIRLERLLPRIEEKWGMLHPHGEAFGSRASFTRTGGVTGKPPAEHSPAPHSEEGAIERAAEG